MSSSHAGRLICLVFVHSCLLGNCKKKKKKSCTSCNYIQRKELSLDLSFFISSPSRSYCNVTEKESGWLTTCTQTSITVAWISDSLDDASVLFRLTDSFVEGGRGGIKIQLNRISNSKYVFTELTRIGDVGRWKSFKRALALVEAPMALLSPYCFACLPSLWSCEWARADNNLLTPKKW